MTTKLIPTALIALLGAAGIAAQAQTFTDRARVQSVEPQYEVVQVPRDECSSQWVTEQRPVAVYDNGNRNVAGAIIGGIAGGLLGHTVGGGSGKQAATAAGVVVGAMAGDKLANPNPQQPMAATAAEQREVRSCRTVMDTQQRINGYRVTYDYMGRLYTTVMPEQPGHSIAVRVSVEPEYHR